MIQCGDHNSGMTVDINGKYRYSLHRMWDFNKESILWFLLNPSTANESVFDPTLIRCQNYSKKWGYGGFRVINVFSLRSPDFNYVKNYSGDIVGVQNDKLIRKECELASKIIVGWGNNVWRYIGRLKSLDKILYHFNLYALKVTNRGYPSHPLYLRKSLEPFLYKKTKQSLLEVINDARHRTS